MYLRFRTSQTTPPKIDDTFENLYQQIHGRLPEERKLQTKTHIKVQVYLVRNQRINGKPHQIYVGAVANIQINLTGCAESVLTDGLSLNIQERLTNLGVEETVLDKYVKRIDEYLKRII